MKFNRSSGIILHPTSLPGPYGIGEIGKAAFDWIDFLKKSGSSLWQVLPLGPTGYGDSPYQCFSAFAGNPYLVSLEDLFSDGLIDEKELASAPTFSDEHVDFGRLIPWKLSQLDAAHQRFLRNPIPDIQTAYQEFQSGQSEWLEDFALFMALKEHFGGGSWVGWPEPLRSREEKAIQKATSDLNAAVDRHKFRQFLFFRQWETLKEYTHRQGIKIIGDIPIFVAHDSADVWSHPELFFLDQQGNPEVVAGVPPDYFSATGQLWGNPLYRWDLHRSQGYDWWLKRIRSVLETVDIVRLDHFRGFAGYWEIPGNSKTAETGRWVSGPGASLFEAIEQTLGSLPIIAEDLGVITEDVEELRDQFHLPGMKILQFAFASDASDPFLPHNYHQNCVVYTGTHDNDTARGWYERVAEDEKNAYRTYFNRSGDDVAWDLIRGVWASVAIFGLAPMQDFLDLDNTARMNYPGNPSGNWSWRMPEHALNETLANKIKEINTIYGRLNDENQKAKQTPKPGNS